MFDIIGKKYYFFALSILFFAFGLFRYYQNGGFNYDIQFQGGTIMEYQMANDNFDTAKAQQMVFAAINKNVSTQKSSTDITGGSLKDITGKQSTLHYLVVNVSSQQPLTPDERTKINDVVYKNFPVAPNAQPETNHVDPSIGAEMKGRALTAVLISSVLIILYIWARFNVMSGLSAGVMAVIGLLHDIAVMISVYTIFNLPINESFIAAVLTIMGYSMNDTIIIYDRVRENSNLAKKVGISELVNRSILQTLARSINTVVTVLICIITVYIFASRYGITSIKEFSLPLIVGIASGCYSSIFISCPLYVMWKEYAQKRVAANKAAARAAKA